MNLLREAAKNVAAAGAATILSQARYDRAILVLSHMRSTTTALANVLCSHPAISGYGETHVPHRTPQGMGRVVLNLAIRKAWDPKAEWVLDKILHSPLDADPPSDFFAARAIFVVRSPAPAITSIRKLSVQSGMVETQSAEGAALYYANRVEALSRLWAAFPDANRIGLTSEGLVSDPEATIERINRWLPLSEPLRNQYTAHTATQIGGGGDPTRSARLNRIEQAETPIDLSAVRDVPDTLSRRCIDGHQALVTRFDMQTGSPHDL